MQSNIQYLNKFIVASSDVFNFIAICTLCGTFDAIIKITNDILMLKLFALYTQVQ